MIIKNNKKRGIKFLAVILGILIIIFAFRFRESIFLMLVFASICAFVFILNLIVYFFQSKVLLEISGENISMAKFGKRKVEITSQEVKEVIFSPATNLEDEYCIIIKYRNNKTYRLGFSSLSDNTAAENFFKQYCKNRNISVKG